MSLFVDESKNTISLTRGDSLVLNVEITQNDELYTPAEGDVVRFALNTKKDLRTDPIILKYIDTSTMQLLLEPSDTKGLDIGSYYYDVELTTADGFVSTFIGPAIFKITSEVY